jgi:hypothetical protein
MTSRDYPKARSRATQTPSGVARLVRHHPLQHFRSARGGVVANRP